MEEIWKDIKGFSRYQVSTLGRIKSKKREYYDIYGRYFVVSERIHSLKPYKLKNGRYDYIKVKLIDDNNIERNIGVHRLVAMTFIPNPTNKKEVDHIDSNRANNRVDNLQWVTKKENMEKAIVPGHNGETNGNSKLTEDDAVLICDYIIKGLSDTKIAEIFNVHASTIKFIREKKHWAYLKEVQNLPDYKPSVIVHTEDDIKLVCKYLREGRSNASIAKELHFSERSIRDIKEKRRWKHLQCVKDL